jgi:hypothetical protein
MKTSLFAFLLTMFASFLISESAFARPQGLYSQIDGPGAHGLCTSKDVGQKWVDEGWCQTLFESITGRKADGDNCRQKLFDELVAKIESGQSMKMAEQLEEYCGGFQQRLAQAPDKKLFIASVLQQILATLVIAESGWKQEAVGPGLKQEDGSMKSAQGLLQLTGDSVQADTYKCGCKDVPSGPLGDSKLKEDGHLSIACGSYIAMHWMNEDGQVGSGSGEGGSKGIARYFQPFRDIDNEKQKKFKEKVNVYCSNMDVYKPVGTEDVTNEWKMDPNGAYQ